MVEFNDGHSTYTDILEREKLRLPNKKYVNLLKYIFVNFFYFSPPLTDIEFFSKNYTIPVEIQD